MSRINSLPSHHSDMTEPDRQDPSISRCPLSSNENRPRRGSPEGGF